MLWMRPSGKQIETNDTPASIAKAKELGWKELVKIKTKPKPKSKAK